MNNILVTGANGQLGSEIQSLSTQFKDAYFYFCDLNTLDITDTKALESYITDNHINIIINCAAYTAVDNAEDDAETADMINHIAVANMGEISKKLQLKLIHISTDYVFDGTNHIPYSENDKTMPIGVYGITKHKGENALLQLNLPNSIIIRTAWVYSSFGNNFVKTMLRLGNERDNLGVIYDQIGSPTYAKHLAQTILKIVPKLNNQNTEVFHYTNEGVCSWYDFSKAIFEIKNIDCSVDPIPSSAYPTKAKRPHYSVLNKQKIKETYNIQIPYWKDALKECLEKI